MTIMVTYVEGTPLKRTAFLSGTFDTPSKLATTKFKWPKPQVLCESIFP